MSDYKLIPLTQGKHAKVSPEDHASLAGFNWFFDTGRYATRTEQTNGRKRNVYMHRQIMGFPTDEVDHINGDTLDNRRSNLRLVTREQNMRNSKGWQGVTSEFKGVCWSKRNQGWLATIRYQHRQLYIGTFHDEADAARARDAVARYLYGEYAWTNFPGSEALTVKEAYAKYKTQGKKRQRRYRHIEPQE